MSKILFSPLGSTDPIAGQRDGAMLHIIRKYRPDKVVLFLSKEICDLEENDHRYSYCLDKLLKLIDHTMKVEWVRREDLVDVFLFDEMHKELKAVVDNIIEKAEPGDEIYLNISSGTPAMKSGLQTIALLSDTPLITIQVTSPVKGINSHEDVKGDYDVEMQWECNLDNCPEEFADRCRESTTLNINAEIIKKIIKKHLAVYDYVAAINSAEQIHEFIDEDAIQLMKSGAARLHLDKPNCEKYTKSAGYDIYPIKQGNHWNIFEYLMIMQIKLNKEEYADYMRSLSPVFTKLLETIIRKYQVVNLGELTYIDRKTQGMRLKEDDKYVTNAELVKYIEGEGMKILDPKIIKDISELRQIESNLRNTAAHNIACINAEAIKNAAGCEPQKILNMLIKLARYVGVKIDDDSRKTYDKLNNKIIELM